MRELLTGQEQIFADNLLPIKISLLSVIRKPKDRYEYISLYFIAFHI